MPTRFPGMDPYLEQPGLWKQVHTSLIVDIQRYLARRLRPKYQVAIEQRTYLSVLGTEKLIGEPDVLVIAPTAHQPVLATGTATAIAANIATNGIYTVELPMPDQIVERYLEVRDAETGEAITVIEILSPSNKLEDRARYERKRLQVLASMTNLVEIDLLRSGKSMTMTGKFPETHYRILISRAHLRPQAQLLSFSIRNPIPPVPIPLRPGEVEVEVPLNQILHDLYDSAGYDLFIDYRRPPAPLLNEQDADWVARLLADRMDE